MRVIFLDMDGVLCTTKAHIAQGKPSKFHGFMEALDREAIGLLNILHDYPEYPVRYVLSSTWRKMHDQEKMEKHLKSYGWTGEFWDGEWKTPNLDAAGVMRGEQRGLEIEDWLSRNKVDGYVILDDDSDMTEDQIVNHFVNTDTYDGLGFQDFVKAERILFGDNSRY